MSYKRWFSLYKQVQVYDEIQNLANGWIIGPDKTIVNAFNEVKLLKRHGKWQLEYTGDVNVQGSNGYTMLHTAAYSCPNVVRWLMQNFNVLDVTSQSASTSVRVNIEVEDGDTPLHIASSNNSKAVRLLLESTSDINKRNKWGNTALHIASKYNEKAVKMLLQEPNIDVNRLNDREEVALHNIFYVTSNLSNRMDALERLLEKYVDVNIQDNFGSTPLHNAVWMPFVNGVSDFPTDAQDMFIVKSVHMLLNKGADISIKDKFGRTAYSMALEEWPDNVELHALLKP